jgi:hypothetical protein
MAGNGLQKALMSFYSHSVALLYATALGLDCNGGAAGMTAGRSVPAAPAQKKERPEKSGRWTRSASQRAP